MARVQLMRAGSQQAVTLRSSPGGRVGSKERKNWERNVFWEERDEQLVSLAPEDERWAKADEFFAKIQALLE